MPGCTNTALLSLDAIHAIVWTTALHEHCSHCTTRTLFNHLLTCSVIILHCSTSVTYNGVYCPDDGDPGCNSGNWNAGVNTSQPSALAPTHLNTTQWAEVLSSFGAKFAWMDAKHGCGFLLWPTKTTLPGLELTDYCLCIGLLLVTC